MTKSISRKKLLLSIGIILAAALLVFGIVKISNALSSHIRLRTPETAEEDLILVAHRGMNALAPENTLEAAQKAADNGYTSMEFDVRRTKDGIWVISHDEDIKRTTDGEGKIGELTYKQILSHRIDSGSKVKDYDLVTIPTLESMLEKCSECSLSPVIEIKEKGTDCIEELLNYIGNRYYGAVSIISFDREQINLAYSLISGSKTSLAAENVSLAWLTQDLSEKTLATAKGNPKIGVSFNGNKAGTEKEINAFKAAGIDLATWTIDKPARLSELYALGIRQFTTNAIVLPAKENK